MNEEVIEYRFYQYPRGDNRGGVLDVDICPTISCSSWQHNCFLIEIYKENNDKNNEDTSIHRVQRL
jgi:hypothetical protein